MEDSLLPQQSFDGKKKIIFVVMLYGFLTQCMNLSILGPFFPIKAQEYEISEMMIGFIFSGFPLGAIVCTLFIRKWMDGNRKNYMVTGVLFYVLGMTGFASIFYVDNKFFIIVGAIICRFIMGIGMSMYDTPALSFIPLLFSHKIDKKLGIIEGIQNVGYMLGPLVGTLLYSLGDYQLPFFVMAALQFVTMPLLLFLLPSQREISEYIRSSNMLSRHLFEQESINTSHQQGSIENQDSPDTESKESGYQQNILQINDSATSSKITEQENKDVERDGSTTSSLVVAQPQNITYMHSIAYFKIFLIISMIVLTASGFLFLDSSFANYLDNEFDLDQDQVNYVFVASYSCSTISAYIVSLFTHSRSTNIKLMISGFCIGYICYFLIGPAPFTFIPRSFVLTIFARCVIAACQSMLYIPAIKEFYFTLSSMYYGQVQDDQIISNMSSTLYIISMQSGEFLGPIVGGFIIEVLSFEEAAAYLAIIAIVCFSLVYMFKKVFKQFEFEEHHFHYFEVKQKISDMNSSYQRFSDETNVHDSLLATSNVITYAESKEYTKQIS